MAITGWNGLNKWDIPTLYYYSALKKGSSVVSYATTQVDLEGIMLS